MAYTTIDNPELYFQTKLYTGNSTDDTAITLDGDENMQPDFVWIKRRNQTANHNLFDSVRGATKTIKSNLSNAEVTNADTLKSFDSDGFTLGDDASVGEVNPNTYTMVAWNWKAGGTAPSKTYTVKVVSDSGNKYRFDDFGTSAVTLDLQEGGTYTFDQSDSSNATHPLRFYTAADKSGGEYTTGVTTTGTAGSSGAKTVITVAASAPTLYYQCSSHSGMGGQANTNSTFGSSNFSGSIQSTVSAGSTQGFSIVSWTGTGANATVGHNLGAVPQMFIIKNRSATAEWAVYHEDLTNAEQVSLFLDLTSAVSGTSSVRYNNTAPTSSVFSLGSSSLYNGSGNNLIGYCFSSIKGYSKVGSYVGTGSDVFIHTGFNVGWLLVKNADNTNGWLVIDTKRSPANPQGKYIYANANSAEGTVTYGEFFSNGFGWKGTSSVAVNQSGNTFIYYAIAESPFVNSNGVPTNAR